MIRKLTHSILFLTSTVAASILDEIPDFIPGIKHVCDVELSQRLVPAITPHIPSQTDQVICSKPTASLTLSAVSDHPFQDRIVKVAVCDQPFAHGHYGFVYEGLMTYSRCSEDNPDEISVSAVTLSGVPEEFHLDASVQCVRKVAVKFNMVGINAQAATDAMNTEIDSMKKLQSEQVVQYLGKVEIVPPTQLALVAPGMITEFIFGTTVVDVIFDFVIADLGVFGTNAQADVHAPWARLSDQVSCYLAQFALFLGTEISAKVLDADLHFGNAMVPSNPRKIFHLSNSISCPQIKIIDLGISHRIGTGDSVDSESRLLLTVILDRLFVNPGMTATTLAISYRGQDAHTLLNQEIVQLFASVFRHVPNELFTTRLKRHLAEQNTSSESDIARDLRRMLQNFLAIHQQQSATPTFDELRRLRRHSK